MKQGVWYQFKIPKLYTRKRGQRIALNDQEGKVHVGRCLSTRVYECQAYDTIHLCGLGIWHFYDDGRVRETDRPPVIGKWSFALYKDVTLAVITILICGKRRVATIPRDVWTIIAKLLHATRHDACWINAYHKRMGI
jgi:hypothetical protein